MRFALILKLFIFAFTALPPDPPSSGGLSCVTCHHIKTTDNIKPGSIKDGGFELKKQSPWGDATSKMCARRMSLISADHCRPTTQIHNVVELKVDAFLFHTDQSTD